MPAKCLITEIYYALVTQYCPDTEQRVAALNGFLDFLFVYEHYCSVG
ncbi:hypothetical protein X970_00260 [Pseudomonas monteilii SB3101]|uniref:Uncharacterized protein n=1 Tax=Pseudomonas monteilii SB3101 TaxID=1435058 RepID=V9VAU3_9PSED|nr:hypothetical protein X970_00260 [Pseudomonas monteilii SB3101]